MHGSFDVQQECLIISLSSSFFPLLPPSGTGEGKAGHAGEGEHVSLQMIKAAEMKEKVWSLSHFFFFYQK